MGAGNLLAMKTTLFVSILLLSLNSLAEELSGKVVGVTDGDTLTLLVDQNQYKIRLAEIDTPEKGQPWGSRATQFLGEKVFQEEIRVTVVDVDRYGRTVGRIWLGDRDINRELVAEGHAWVYRQYMTDRSLLNDEREAREQQLGLWSLENPVPPWEWRRGARGISTKEYNPLCGNKRYCREMSDCAEAKFYLQECGLNRLDGDNDGVPCESLCRK